MNLEIANRLVQLRRDHGFSQETLAEKLGVSRQAVSKWERAEACPDIENLIQLADLYNISLDSLLRGLSIEASEPPPASSGNTTAPEQDPPQPKTCPDPPPAYRETEPSSSPSETCPTVCTEPARKHSGLRIFLLSFPYPLLIAFLFFFFGMLWGRWHPAWILFLTIPLYYPVVHALYPKDPNRPRSCGGTRTPLHQFFLTFPYPVLTLIVFLLLGFTLDCWRGAWLAFLTIPIYYILVNSIFNGMETNRSNRNEKME